MRNRLIQCLLLLMLPVSGTQAVDWGEDLDAALRDAQQRERLVLVDFYAPWCYSCYFMDENVLSLPALDEHATRMEFVKLDVDAPAGAAARDRWKIKFLPSYLVLNSQGEEVGRIAGEQTAEAFYAELSRIARSAATVAQLQARFDKAPALLQPGLATQILSALVGQQDPAAARRWLESLPATQRQRLLADPAVATQANRAALRLTDDPAEAERIGRALLAADTGCALPYEIVTMNPRIAPDPARLPAALRAQQIAALEPFVQQRLLGDGPACADQRTGVLVLHGLYQSAGRQADAKALLDQARAHLRDKLGGTDVDALRADRWRADNLRVFTAAAGDTEALLALNAVLIEAFPQDYVYPYRQGRLLLREGRADEALAPLALAAKRAYGVNRLRIARHTAEALQRLGQTTDAVAAINAALRQTKRFCPAEAAELRAYRDSLQAG